MNSRKPDEMEKSHNVKSARNAFMFYAVVLFVWTVYDFIATGDLGLQMTIFLGGMLVFLWSKVILSKQTETKEKKVNIPSKAILWAIFYFVVFLFIILIINFFF